MKKKKWWASRGFGQGLYLRDAGIWCGLLRKTDFEGSRG